LSFGFGGEFEMTETIQQLKEDIAILQEKLQKLEELQRTKSPAEEAFRKVYYRYPDKLDDKYGSAWDIFEKGYNASKVTEVEPSMTNCVLLGNPPDGYVTWNEWYNEMGSKGILHNLKISDISAKEYQQKSEKEQKWDVVRESVKWCKEHREESVEDYLTPQGPQGPVGPGPGPKGVMVGYEPTLQEPEENDWKTVALLFGKKLPVILPYAYDELSPNAWYTWVVFNYDYYIKQRDIESGRYPTPPQTPEQIEKSLRTAFGKAQQTEEWKETQRKIDAPKESWMNKSDEELVAMLEKNPPDCLKFVMGKTLEQIIERWWCDTFTGTHEKWSMEECIDDLIDQIELFLPRSQSSEGTQNIDTVVAVEAHNELLQKIKSKFRNKKDT
jgi:hypothetical protein